VTVAHLLQALARPLPTPRPAVLADASGDQGSRRAEVIGVTHDSRRVGPGVVFVALRGQKADGRAFAPQAIAAGAVAVVAEAPPDAPVAVPWVVVPEARTALALLAAEFYEHPSRQMTVVGITGTNGKTTTSYLLSAMFGAAGVRCGLMGTVTYRIGDREISATRTTPEAPDVQAFLRDMVSADCGACVMEVSSHALALHRVDGMHFAAAVFTNLTRDHLDFHADMESYFAAKRKLFDMLPPGAPAVINVDDPRGPSLVASRPRVVTYAIDHPADVTPGPQTTTAGHAAFDIRTPRGIVHADSPLLGRPNVSNILAAAAAADAVGLPLDAIAQGIRTLTGVPGRFEVISRADDDITVIVDYAHTDDALRSLLETARSLAPTRLITVFGCGGDRDRSKRPLMGMVAARLSDIVVITSDNPRSEDPAQIVDDVLRGTPLQGEAEILPIVDRREAVGEAIRRAATGDVVLIAGKGHEKYQEIAGRVLPFDDVAIAKDALTVRRSTGRIKERP
jgi:UDP-N-acetylmuramoyl-L-alanyl-D-glutamate--2,6-diaminopimelate ligase